MGCKGKKYLKIKEQILQQWIFENTKGKGTCHIASVISWVIMWWVITWSVVIYDVKDNKTKHIYIHLDHCLLIYNPATT